VILTFGVSVALVGSTWLRLTLAALGVGLVVFLALLPTTARNEAE